MLATCRASRFEGSRLIKSELTAEYAKTKAMPDYQRKGDLNFFETGDKIGLHSLTDLEKR